MKFILCDDSGRLSGRYDSEIHGENIPEEAVSVSDELFFRTINEIDGVWTINFETGDISLQPFPPPTDEQLASMAITERDALLREAATRIAPLQDAVDLGVATPEEESLLTAWKQYRIALNRIANQVGFPQVIDWPNAPQGE